MLLGAVVPTSVLIYGQFNRDTLNASLAARGLSSRSEDPRRRSWDPFDPDGTIGLAKTKKLLGEFAYHVTDERCGAGRRRLACSIHPASRAVPHRASERSCNKTIKADLTAALQAVVDAGLAGCDRRRQRQHLRRLFRPEVQPHRRHPAGFAVAAHVGAGARHQHGVELPGLRPADGLPRRADLPGPQLRVGWQLLEPRRHALRVGRRAAQHVSVPVQVLPERAGGAIESFGLGDSHDSRDSVMFADDGWALVDD